MRRGLRQKIRNGVWPGWAPVGYTNNPETRGVDIDEVKAPKVKKLFEMYAAGSQTLLSLANWCEQKNLRGNLGKKIAISNVQKILTNPFYIGLMRWKGEIFEGQHEPLISKKLFEFVLSLNQAVKLVENENKKEMTTFLKNIGSNHILQNRQLIFSPKIPYNLVAEPAEAGEANLTIPRWCVRQDSNLRPQDP